jgi:hypothetical protein
MIIKILLFVDSTIFRNDSYDKFSSLFQNLYYEDIK